MAERQSGIITQDELDTLQTSIEVAGQRRRAPSAPATAALYDFRHASKLSPDHMRQLQGRMVALVGALNRTMSLYLNTSAQFSIHSMDTTSHEQYVRNLAVNPVLGVVSFGAGASPALWEMSAPLAYAALDCMLGGDGTVQVEAGVEPTVLERSVLRRLYTELLSAWTERWDRLKLLRPQVETVVSSPGAAGLRPTDERFFCVTVQVGIAQTTGMLRLCIPLGAVKRLLREEREAVRAADVATDELPTSVALADAPLPLVAVLEPPPLTLAALADLQPGTVLNLRVPATASFTVAVGNMAKFRARAGVSGGRIAVQLLADTPD